MSSYDVLMIPHLSKELNLIGFSTLPYSLKKPGKRKKNPKLSEEPLEITFNSRSMINALASTCVELVKRVKTIEVDDSVLDKLKFENSKLEKQLKLNKLETEKILNDLANVKKVNQQLQEEADLLKRKLRDHEKEQHSLSKKNQTSENALKHALKKKESDLLGLHKLVWKQFNMANQNYFPENFKLIQLNQPDFSKLWSTVKYSDAITREEALKEALGVFQKNNKGLMEENFSLKMSFLTVLQEIYEMLKLMVDKLHLPASVLIDFKVQDIFEDIEIFNVSAYTNILKEHFKVINRVCELFVESSFTVSDDLFVCWSDIIKSL